jgi:hypothetical protein
MMANMTPHFGKNRAEFRRGLAAEDALGVKIMPFANVLRRIHLLS